MLLASSSHIMMSQMIITLKRLWIREMSFLPAKILVKCQVAWCCHHNKRRGESQVRFSVGFSRWKILGRSSHLKSPTWVKDVRDSVEANQLKTPENLQLGFSSRSTRSSSDYQVLSELNSFALFVWKVVEFIMFLPNIVPRQYGHNFRIKSTTS